MTTNNSRGLLATAVVALSLVCAAPARASLVEAASFEDKVEHAKSIVLGRCVKTESRWDESRKLILTYSTFKVEKAMKGDPQTEVTIVTPGGSVGDVHQSTIGVPNFAEGQENVLFVRDSKVGPTVLYFDQGTYDVTNDGRGRRIVAPVASEAVQVDTQRGMAVTPETPRTVEEFERAIRAAEKVTAQRMQMELVKERATQTTSIGDILARNKALVTLAIIGAILATWQLLRRS